MRFLLIMLVGIAMIGGFPESSRSGSFDFGGNGCKDPPRLYPAEPFLPGLIRFTLLTAQYGKSGPFR